ncbi:MAG: helix-turn-helix domain-containing protein [Rhodobacterales bacterium]
MIRSNFLSRDDRRELLSCVKRQREDHGVARRANALLLLDDGKSCVEIAQVLYLDDDTVRGWHKQYLSEGWDAVAYHRLERWAIAAVCRAAGSSLRLA